jgi:hypothetical protein
MYVQIDLSGAESIVCFFSAHILPFPE